MAFEGSSRAYSIKEILRWFLSASSSTLANQRHVMFKRTNLLVKNSRTKMICCERERDRKSVASQPTLVCVDVSMLSLQQLARRAGSKSVTKLQPSREHQKVSYGQVLSSPRTEPAIRP